MERKIAVIGATGKKSGGAFLKKIFDNLFKIDKKFGGGYRFIAHSASNSEQIKNSIPNAEIFWGECSYSIIKEKCV